MLSSSRTTINLMPVNGSDNTTVRASSRQKYEKNDQMDKYNKTKSFLKETQGEIRVKRRFRRQERVTVVKRETTARNDPDRNHTKSPDNELGRVETLPKPVAQIQPTDLPTEFTSIPEWGTSPVEDFEEVFTPFIPFNTRSKNSWVKNPFYPVTGESYGAYAVVLHLHPHFHCGNCGNIAIMA